MGWNQRLAFRFFQATDSYESGKYWQCKENFQPSDFYVFLTFILIVLAFSAFALARMGMDEKSVARNRHLVLNLDSFSIIDFKVMENQLVANWTARFIFINKKIDVDIRIEAFDLLAFYKGTNLVSCASLTEPLVLKTMYQGVIEVEFSREGCKGELVSINDHEVLQEMEEDLKKGKISLNLNLGLEARRRYEGRRIWRCGVEFEPTCALDLEFNSTKLLSAQRFSETLANKCQIPLPA